MQVNNNISLEILKDKNNGKEKPWKEHKMDTIELSESYYRLGLNKASRVEECGSYLEFKRFSDDSMKLNHANFCKVRLCPMCAWRRSLKVFGQVSSVMNYLENKYEYLFLTLTQRNVPPNELANELDKLFAGYKTLAKRKTFKQISKGWFRALEVTHNIQKDTYHPHFHVIIAVSSSYFKSRDYISQDTWVKLWRNILELDYNPIVDVRKYKPKNGNKKLSKEIAEVAKYTIKSNDYIIKDINGVDEEATDKAVLVLDSALANRRLVAFGGELRKAHKLLNLDDTENGDLIHTDNDELREDLEFVIEHYHWNIGYSNYIKKDL